jgi:hypothetical protein
MSKTVEEILAPKPEARPRIYAYSIADEAHKGLLKVGQTTRDVKQRVAEQLKTAAIKNYKVVLDESAERVDGTIFRDHHVRAALVKKGTRIPSWNGCAAPSLTSGQCSPNSAPANSSPVPITRPFRCVGSSPRL